MELDKEHSLWVKIILIAFAIPILTIGSCNAHVDYRIAKAIEQGCDPILARAAFSYSNGSYERIIHIAKQKGE